MWAILGNGSDQMFKLDLQRDSLGRAHRQHSQILWANSFTFHTMFYENRSGLIFDFLTFVLGKQVMKSMSVTWPIPVRTSPSSCCWCISMNFLIEPSDTLSDLGGINCPGYMYDWKYKKLGILVDVHCTFLLCSSKKYILGSCGKRQIIFQFQICLFPGAIFRFASENGHLHVSFASNWY